MKKTLSIILCIAFFSLSLVGCSSDDNAPTNQNATKYTTQGKETKLIADETATGELLISCYNSNSTVVAGPITASTQKFQELYPNVKLTVDFSDQGLGLHDYIKKMSTEIMAGDGPDIFFVSEVDADINKMMRSGVLADMKEYFENDKNFNISDYNEEIFTGGQPEGKQYIIPLSYNVPLIFTTKKIIEKTGFNVSNCKDYLSCLKEIDTALKNGIIKNTDNTWNINSAPIYFPKFSGIKHLDYDNNKAVLDLPELKEIYALLKEHRDKYTDDSMMVISSPTKELIENFKNESLLFTDFATPFLSSIQAYLEATVAGEEPVLIPIRNVNGKITADTYDAVAVKNNSKNKQSAYNFIKILINPEMYSLETYFSPNIPISNVSVANLIKRDIASHKAYSENEQIDYDKLEKDLLDAFTSIINDTQDIDYFIEGNFVFKDEMYPYLNGEKSFEECLENAKRTIEIYLSE